MEIYKVYFVSQEIAEQLKPEPYWACISITSPGEEAKLQEGWSDILRLQFHDTGGKYNNYKDYEENGNLIAMTDEQADEVIDFLDKIEADRKTRYLIVHCHAGISRSAAVASFAHYNYTPIKYKMLGCDNQNHFVRNKLEWAYHRKHIEEKEGE